MCPMPCCPAGKEKKEFAAFPGAILMTTNCIQKPTNYTDRIFTTGLVAFPGVRHIDDKKDFTPVIEAALAAPGFEEDGDDKRILVDFGHNTVLNAAGKVVELVKAGKIRHFFLVGGSPLRIPPRPPEPTAPGSRKRAGPRVSPARSGPR